MQDTAPIYATRSCDVASSVVVAETYATQFAFVDERPPGSYRSPKKLLAGAQRHARPLTEDKRR